MDRDSQRRFNGGKIAIVLSKETNAVGELVEIDGSLGGQSYRYSSLRPRGFPSTSAAMTARTRSGPVPNSERRRGRCTSGAAGGSLRGGGGAGRGGADGGGAGFGGGAGRGCGPSEGDAACARACSRAWTICSRAAEASRGSP